MGDNFEDIKPKINKKKILTGDELAAQCYDFLSVNAQKGFDSSLLTVNIEKNEVKFKNGARILFDIIDESEDVIDWRLIDRRGDVVDVSKHYSDMIESELLDLLIDETPFDYRDNDELMPGYRIGIETHNKKEQELNESKQQIKENFFNILNRMNRCIF